MRLSARAVAGALLVVWLGAFAVLFVPWGDIQDHTHWYKVTWVPFSAPLKPVDVVGNIVAFIPFGALSTLTFGTGKWWDWLIGIALALLLALGAEAAQLYSHLRFPSATDLSANVLGAALGVWLVRRRSATRDQTDNSLAAR